MSKFGSLYTRIAPDAEHGDISLSCSLVVGKNLSLQRLVEFERLAEQKKTARE